LLGAVRVGDTVARLSGDEFALLLLGTTAAEKGRLPPTGTRACDLELEITESTLISDTGPAIAALEALRRLGVGIAIDDFGTGYSSLSYLRRFPVDRLKLDMSFIAGLGRDDDSAKHGDGALVAAAINLAHALGVEAVAEGVENVEQLRTLVAFGCEQGVGHLWTKPLLADDVVPWLARPHGHS
jgi:diguanylate cyclase